MTQWTPWSCACAPLPHAGHHEGSAGKYAPCRSQGLYQRHRLRRLPDQKGLPFRDAYKLTGCMVADCIAQDKTLEELTLEQFQQYSPLFAPDIYARPSTWYTAARTARATAAPAPPVSSSRSGRHWSSWPPGRRPTHERAGIHRRFLRHHRPAHRRPAGRPGRDPAAAPAGKPAQGADRPADAINSADLAFLCLPDAASREILPLLRPDVKVLDTSTAFRTAPGWVYGFPELRGQSSASSSPAGWQCPAATPADSSPGTAPGGAGTGAAGVSLQLHRLIRVQRRRQKR